MSGYVVDASVAVKWFVPEVHSDQAERLLESAENLHAPDLLLSEVGNIVWKKQRRGEITQEEAREIVYALTCVPFLIHPSLAVVEAALELAIGYDRTVYDCIYLAMAEALRCPLVTADERLFNSLQTTPHASTVTLVQQFD